MNAIVLVCIPQSVTSGASPLLRLSIAIQPMLDGPALGASGMASWPPAALGAGALQLEFATDPGSPVLATRPAITLAVQPGLWAQVFAAELAVVPQDGTADPREIRVKAMASAVERASALYATAASQPVSADGGTLAEVAMPPDALDEADPDPLPANVPVPAVARPPEFHRTVALLREHPALLRALGLVFDIECRLDAIASLPVAGVVRIVWPDAPTDIPATLSPWTAFERDDTAFVPRSTDRVRRGMLNFAGQTGIGSGWSVTTLDADVALARLRRDVADHGGAPAAIPALRSGGITLLDQHRAERVMRRRVRRGGRATAAIADMVLDADDLLLGYRIDVRRGDGSFQSLCARLATYRFAGAPLQAGEQLEEGNIKDSAAFDYGDGVLRTDEQFVRWQGWSLSVASPLAMAANAAPVATGFSWSFRVPPGSLPRLRFGGKYHLRARAVDLAGGGLALNARAAETNAIGPVFYRRFEPIGAPATLSESTVAFGPGESDSTIVARSDHSMTPASFAAANPRYPQLRTRAILAPRVPLNIVEQHMMLDAMDPATASAVLDTHGAVGERNEDFLFPDPAASGVATVHRIAPAEPRQLLTRGWPAWPERKAKRVALQPASVGSALELAWGQPETVDTLVVKLAPGRQVSIDLSSTMQEGFPDQFEASVNLPDEDSRDAAMNGTHPLLTPATAITLVHAVRRPLAEPAGRIGVVRQPGRTTAVLLPDPPLLGLDLPSTAAVQMIAGWDEVDDTDSRRVTDNAVGRSSLSLGAAAFDAALEHEFGDTRHRRVTYAAIAESRYRHFFHADEGENLFRVQAAFAAVDIPSTVAPPVPEIRDVIPAFGWIDEPLADDQVAARHRTALLRVVLAPPWNLSGAGEQLAVILASQAAVDPRHHHLITQVARDATHAGHTPRRFPGFEAITPQPSNPMVEHRIAGSDVLVSAIPHDVWHDGTQWNCDIAINGFEQNYMPVIRLAVARYQRHSLEGRAFSPVVTLPPAALLPDRRLSVSRSGQRIVVRLDGVGSAGASANTVAVDLQTCPAAVAGAAEASATIDQSVGLALWQTDVARSVAAGLNADIILEQPVTDDRVRLVVRESEQIETGPDDLAVGSPHTRRRTIYADIVLLS